MSSSPIPDRSTPQGLTEHLITRDVPSLLSKLITHLSGVPGYDANDVMADAILVQLRLDQLEQMQEQAADACQKDTL